MSNKMDDLREVLFKTLDSLMDPTKPLEIDRAKAVAEVSQTIINSAKVQVDYCRVTGSMTNMDFITGELVPKKPALESKPNGKPKDED